MEGTNEGYTGGHIQTGKTFCKRDPRLEARRDGRKPVWRARPAAKSSGLRRVDGVVCSCLLPVLNAWEQQGPGMGRPPHGGDAF